jgi:hypothetical protein
MLELELPESLQQEFEQTAQKFYDHEGVKRAAIEAIELWLAGLRQRQVDAQAKANNQAFEKLQAELIDKYFGK